MADVQPNALPLVTTTASTDVFIKQNGSTGVVEQVAAGNMIPAGGITPSKLGTGASTALVAANETTTAGFAVDLGTVGPSVTVTIGANGLALVAIKSFMICNTGGAYAYLGIDVSGASTIAATTSRGLSTYGLAGFAGDARGATFLFTGLSAGSTTFKLKYGVGGTASGTYQDRYITVVPL